MISLFKMSACWVFLISLGLGLGPVAHAQAPNVNKPKPTIAQLEAALNKNPARTSTREALGRAYLNKKNYAKVIEVLAPYSNEISTEALIDLAQAYGDSGDSLSEIRVLQAFADAEPQKFRPHHLLGMALKKDKKYDDAAKSLRRAIELAPKHRPSYEALIEIFSETKQNYESRTLLSDMVKIFGPKKEFAHRLCKLYAMDSFLKEAQEACKLAIKLDPRLPDSHIYLAQTYYDLENPQAAERILKTASRQFPKSEFTQYATGEYYLNEKNYPAAVRYLDAAVKISPEAVRSQLTLAIALFESRDHTRALVHYEKACNLDKSNESLTALKNAAARLRKIPLLSLSEQYDRKAATCQKM